MRQYNYYSEINGEENIWTDTHTLDQWQEAYIDSRDRYVLTLSFLKRPIEYTMEVFDLKGKTLLTWRIIWTENNQINFTSDLKYTLIKHKQRLTLYQLY